MKYEIEQIRRPPKGGLLICYVSYRECALKSAADCVEIQAGGMSNTV